MPPEAWAILSSFLLAGANVVAKRALQKLTVIASLLVSLPTALLILVGSVIANPPTHVSLQGASLFLLAGVAGFVLGSWATISAVDKLGAGRAVPIQQGTRPVVVLSVAAVLLREQVGAVRIIGVIAIVLGCLRLALRDPMLATADSSQDQDRWFQAGTVFSLLAGFGYALYDLLTKEALSYLPDPAFGGMLALAVGVLIWCGVAIGAPSVRAELHWGRSVTWALVSGCFLGLGNLTLVMALQEGDVSLVSPIVASQPLTVLLLSRVFLRGIEPFQAWMLGAGTLIVAGTILVSITR